MGAVRDCALNQKHWGQSQVEFDETNITAGQRDFATSVNKTTVGFIQATRYLGVNPSFALPSSRLMDCEILEVAHVNVRITGRNDNWAWGSAYRIRPNEFSNSPRFFYPKMGTLKIANPLKVKDLREDLEYYEKIRDSFNRDFFKLEDMKAAEKRQKEKILPPAKFDYIGYVVQNPEKFYDPKHPGQLKLGLVQAGPLGTWKLSAGKASQVKHTAQAQIDAVKAEGGIEHQESDE